MLGVGHCSHWAEASDCLGRLQQITHRLLLRHQQRKQHTGICSHQSISNYPDSFYQQIWASENLNGSHQHLLSFFIPKQIHLSFLLQTSENNIQAGNTFFLKLLSTFSQNSREPKQFQFCLRILKEMFLLQLSSISLTITMLSYYTSTNIFTIGSSFLPVANK